MTWLSKKGNDWTSSEANVRQFANAMAKNIYEYFLLQDEEWLAGRLDRVGANIGGNIAVVVDAIVATGDAEYICQLYNFVKERPNYEVKVEKKISKLVDAICAIGDAEYIFRFYELGEELHSGNRLSDSDTNKLRDTICTTGDAEYIDKFYRMLLFRDVIYFKYNIEKNKFVDGICASGSVEYIYKWIRITEDEEKEKLIDAMCASGNIEYIYETAKIVPSEYTEKLIDAMCASGNVEYIYETAKIAPSEYIEKLMDSMLNTRDIEHIIKMKRRMVNKFLLDEKDFNQKEREVITDDGLILASLTNSNVSVSTIKENEVVKQNKELYLSLLEQLNGIKYLYYKDAFDGNISFESADEYYKVECSKNSSYNEDQYIEKNIYNSCEGGENIAEEEFNYYSNYYEWAYTYGMER